MSEILCPNLSDIITWLYLMLKMCKAMSESYLTMVAQYDKRWPTDLTVLGSRPVRENLSNPKRGSIAHSLSEPPSHRPDMTEVMLKRT